MEELPLTPRVLLILWALQSGPKHGYRLLSDVEELGRGRVTIGPASLYEAIQSLRKKGWIERSKAPDDAETQDRRRRYFELTDQGTEVLQAEAARLGLLVEDLRASGVIDQASA